jgi:uncharacterized integral membrane protein
MDQDRPVRMIDLSDVRIRVATVRFGIWSTLLVCGVGVAYCFASWSSPNRPLMLILLLAAMGAALIIGVLDAERIVRSRWRELFFLSWSLLDIAFIATIEALDGGARSPIVGIYFLPLVFAAISYPLALVCLIALIDVAAALGIGAFTGRADWIYLRNFASELGSYALL